MVQGDSYGEGLPTMMHETARCSQCGEYWYADHQCKSAPEAGVPQGPPVEVEAQYTLKKIRELIAHSAVDFDANIGG